ncbi:hypothetical protein CRT60_00450 [Azospirillum palustre]|uniref:Uncharacterized protein n=1 Tax=Azospirillum palustre TaxID=2044885 RepID=A0A2B8BQD3_9PROT|nr:hypothetical protein [Azospirillum palustre]PGH59437.1 hypothetical protein CRT60_00450 [Azospirillum palustre]
MGSVKSIILLVARLAQRYVVVLGGLGLVLALVAGLTTGNYTYAAQGALVVGLAFGALALLIRLADRPQS